MAEQNPIKYSDLISPDDSIEKLITQLTQVNELFGKLSADIKSSAAAIQQSLKSVSGATEQGRQATQRAASEAENLARAENALAYAQSETAKQVAILKEQTKQATYQNKLEAQQAAATAGSYNALSAQYRINKIVLNNLSAEERANNTEAKKLEEETKAIYEQMKKLQEATGNTSLNVGNYTKSIEGAIGMQSKWYQGLQSLGALFQGGFKSGVQQAGHVVAGFGKQLLALLANPIVATIAAITAAFMALAKGISSSEENTNTLMRILAPFERVLTGVISALQTTVGWILKAVEGFENLAMGASKLAEKLPFVGGAFKKVNDALRENINLTIAKQNLDKAERENTVTQATLMRNVAKWRRDAEMSNDPKRRIQLLKMANAAEERMMYNEIGLAKEALRIAEARAAQSQNDKETNDALAQARVRLLKAEENYYQRTTRLQSKIRNITNSADKGGGGSNKSSEVDKAQKEAAELEKIQKQKDQRELSAKRAAEDAKVALMEDSYDRQRAQAILSYDRQIEDAKAKMSELGADEVETKKYYDELIISLEQQKWAKLADIANKQMKDITDAETRDYEQRIKATDKLIEQQRKKKSEKKDIYDLLGLNLDDDKKQAINTSVQFAIDSLNQFMDAYVQAAEAKAQLATQEVDRAQRTLQLEMEARNAGYANDVESARKELELAKQTERKALEEQKKAQKQRAAIQAVEQVGNLISASALIWSQLGFPWAIPALAVMWASFAASKVMAVNAAGAGSEAYGEGTVELLEGGSHQSGNDIDLGRKKDGTRRRAEGGEFFAVINKRNSRKYRDVIPDVINSLNQGTFAERYMRPSDSISPVIVDNSKGTDLRELTASVNDIREQGRTRTYTDGSGNMVVVYKNLKRIIKNGN